MVKAGPDAAAFRMVLVALQQIFSGQEKPVRSEFRTGYRGQNVAPAFTM
jgi:hypothetical protein